MKPYLCIRCQTEFSVGLEYCPLCGSKDPLALNAPRNRLKRRFAPGVWQDEEGNAHFSIPEFLENAGMEDTPANRAWATQVLEELIGKFEPLAQVVHRDRPT